MEIQEIIKTVQNSQVYKNWRERRPEDILAHICVIEKEKQVGYYLSTTKKMTTFDISNAECTITENQEILEAGEIQELQVKAINVDINDARKISSEILLHNYPRELVVKTIIVVHQRQNPTYTITLLTQSLKTIIINISANDGSIIDHTISTLIEVYKPTQ